MARRGNLRVGLDDGSGWEMRIVSFLERCDVIGFLPVGSKREVLACLVELLVKNHPELDGCILQDILMKREDLRSTGIEQGVAFPHGRVPGLTRLIACFARSREGVDFNSFDGQPTHFFFLLLIPENAQGAHLKALARLNRLFHDSALCQQLLEAGDEEGLFGRIVEEDLRCG